MFDYVLLRKYCKDISVLFVEDDENILKEMHLLLKDLFDFVNVAKNGEEAFLKYTNYYKENKKNYDLLITDILMPIVNGIELIKSVYSINKKQLVMVLSAYSEKEYLVELINIGICKFILKPIDYETFLDDIFNISKTIYEKSQVSNVKNSNRIYLNDELYWDKYTKQLFSNNSVVKLTKKEFILIELLILNGNTIYSNDRIINYLWEDYSDFDIQIINLKNIISRLRKKIPSLNIQNNYGFGYSLEILH